MKTEFQTLGEKNLEEMLSKAEAYLSDLVTQKNPRWITFSGKSGVGKTMLAKNIYSEFYENHRYYERENGTTGRYDCGFYSATKITNTIRAGDFGIIEQLKREHLVCIDDILAEHPSDFIASQWYDILNARLGKWTILTTNKTLNQIANEVDARIASRIIRDNNELIICDTKDYGFRKLERCK